MKKILILVLVTVLTGACSVLQTPPKSAPVVDSQATIAALVQTSEAQTKAAQPSPTIASATETGAPLIASSPTLEFTSTPSITPIPNLTTTPATATSGPANTLAPTSTATQPAGIGTPTLTPTLGIMKYGTLPPAVPSAKITIINESKAQAYISLQTDPPHELAILEYPVQTQVKLHAPLGYYTYVVWVGGRQITGEFTLHKDDDLTITIYKTKVTIK